MKRTQGIHMTLMALSCLMVYPAVSQSAEDSMAMYVVVFNSTWSAETHPTDFPTSPHFSGLIGATHNSTVKLWEAGGLASPGIKNMAETGGKDPMNSEIETLIQSGPAGVKLSGGGINPSPGTVSLDFEISIDFPLVTLVSMIAPSPDWFVGVSELSLMAGGEWVDELVVDLHGYDAGTDSGATFASSNAETTPAEPIAIIQTAPLVLDAMAPVPLGTFTFTRQRTTAVSPGAAKLAVTWGRLKTR